MGYLIRVSGARNKMTTLLLSQKKAPAPIRMRVNFTLRSWQIGFSLLLLIAFTLVALAAPWIAPADPYYGDYAKADLKPIWQRPDTSIEGFWLGSDRYGRDVFSRLIYGTRTSFLMILTIMPAMVLIGLSVGVVSGYLGKTVDAIWLHIADILNSFPTITFAVLIILVLRDQPLGSWMDGMLTLTIAYTTIGWVGLARLTRAAVLQLKQQAFIEAARALGASNAEIIWRHLIPNTLHLVTVWVVNTIPTIILLEATLGYLGIEIIRTIEGKEFNVTSWGGLFFEGRRYIFSNPFILLAPALCIFLISLGCSLLSETLNRSYQK